MTTLLTGTNEVLKRVQLIQGDSGILTTLTDSARQVYIDTAVQMWNETIDELYSISDKPKPKELAENTITLTTSTRAYALQTDLLQLYWPFLDETNGRFITEYPGGYLDLVTSQLVPANYTGLPIMGCIRPTDGYIYLDRIPTSNENGLIYKYRYDKSLNMTTAAAVFPFNDAVFRSLVPSVAELWKKQHNNKFDNGIYQNGLGRASRYLLNLQQRDSWTPARVPVRALNITNPFNE